MEINAGELNQRIRILRKTYPIIDGVQTVVETGLRECWAKVTFQSGSRLAQSNGMAAQDIQNVSTRFLVRWSRKDIGRLDTIRHAGVDYDIQYINDYNAKHQYQEILATHNLFRSTFLAGRICTIYTPSAEPVSAGKSKKLEKTVQLLTAETVEQKSGGYTAGRMAETHDRTVRLLRTESLSTYQLCAVDGVLYQISEITQNTDPAGLLVTDLHLLDPGGNWRDRYVF